MTSKTWHVEEMVALIAVYFKCKNNANISVQNELEELSKQLNFRAIKLNIPRDDKYRNYIGMKLMYQNIRFIDTNGKNGMSSTSVLMNAVYKMYFEDSEKFNRILSEFKEKYCFDKVADQTNDFAITESLTYYDYTNFIYDEAILILYLYRCSLQYTGAYYLSEYERILKALKKVAEHYELQEITTFALEKIIEDIRCFYNEKNKVSNFKKLFNSFMLVFLDKYEGKDYNDLKNITDKIIFRHYNNYFEEDNYFQMFRLENIDGLEKRIADSRLSTRAKNALQRSNVHYLFDLLCLTNTELDSKKNLGKKCLDEINQFVFSLKNNSISDNNSDSDKRFFESSLEKPVDYFFEGDFSEYEIENSPVIRKFKYAHEIIDPDLIKACRDNPIYVCVIMNALYNFSVKNNIINDRKNTIRTLLDNLSETKRKNKYVYYANAFKMTDVHLMDFCYDNRSEILENVSDNFDYLDDNYYNLLKKFLAWCAFDVKEDINCFFDKYFKGRIAEVVSYRANKMSLEQVGDKIGFTKERVRQLESKIQRIFDHDMSLKKVFHKLHADLNGKTIIGFEDIGTFSTEHGNELWFLLKNSKIKYCQYDSDKNTIILCGGKNYNNIQIFIQSLPSLISERVVNETFLNKFDMDLLDDFRMMMDYDYYLYKEYYFKKNSNFPDAANSIIKLFFKTGIKIYDSDDLNRFRNIYSNIFNNLKGNDNDRNLSARLSRLLIPIGKGLYSCKNDTYIPEELLECIEKYIDSSSSGVFMTQTIYSKFENELNELGVTNRYALHAILKEKFNSKYYFHRDFISKNSNNTSVQSDVINYIRSSATPVSKEQIKLRLPGITDVMVSLYLSEEDIINLFGSYISADNIYFENEELKYINNIINGVTRDHKQHHSREVYECIVKERPYLLKSHFIYSQYALFSVIEYFFNDNYNFDRPYIANKKVVITKPIDMIKNKFYGNDSIDVLKLLDFTKEIQYQIPCVLDFVLQFNDEYLLCDKRIMISIDYYFQDKDLSWIASQLETVIESEVVDYMPIRDLTCFNKFPKLEVEWSEWLVYSIIYKYGKKFKVMTPNKVFKFAIPVIVRSEFEFDNVKIDENAYNAKDSISSNVNEIKLDDLDDIDNLIADFIEEEL